MDIISTTEALDAACATLSNETYVTVDTEFLRDSPYWPVLCLIQVAAPKGDALIIDPLADGLDMTSFYALMANKSVIKVFHAARQDIEIFWHEAKTLPDPLFDTQVAAMVCGFGDSVGYENIVKRVTGEQVDKSSRFTDWSKRPLTDKQLRYAAADVTHLRQVYEHLARRITKSGRAEWVAEEMAILQDPDTYEVKPENAWRRLKLRNRSRKAVAVLMEAAAWREREAQGRNVPRGRILKDDAIQEIATQAPTSTEALANLRAVPRGFSQSRHAKSLWMLSKMGSTSHQVTSGCRMHLNSFLKDLDRQSSFSSVAEIQCEAHDVAQKLICNVADLERIAADDNAHVSALRGWRREIFGNDALDLKHGRLCLAIENQLIKPVRLEQEAAE